MMESESEKMECFAVYSPMSLPVPVNLSSALLLPSPFPEMVAVFVISSESKHEDLSLKATIVNHANTADSFDLGSITQDSRAFCWQPHQAKDFTIPLEEHSYHLHLDTAKQEADQRVDQEETEMESSQTDSQDITESQDIPESQEVTDSQPEAERLCSTMATSSSPFVERSLKDPKQNEETPQLQVQGTPHRPPHLSHSASKKRKTKHGEDSDVGTPPSTRKRQSSRQRPLPPMSSPLSSKVDKQNSANPKRPQNPGVKKESDTEPSSRWGHTLCNIGNHKCLLIGGQGHRQTISRDAIWMLNTETGGWTVPEIESSSDKFPSRMGHTATFDRDLNSVFVFGGSKNLRWFSDMHILDLATMKWSLVEAAGEAPTRAYHSATFFRNELYVFGGVYPNPDPQPDGCSNDVVIFNPESKSWYKPVTMGTKPKPRSGHSATLLGDQLVIFGGWDAPICYNDLHILDLCLMEFTSPKMIGTPPSPRSWHASIALPGNKVLIHGGYNGNEALSDSFIFHLDTYTWSEVKLHSRVPVGIRAGHAITCYHGNKSASKDEKENHMPMVESLAIFGGGDNEDNFFGDLVPFSWTYSNFLDF
nr:rab9 effector protein with kelch motifs-like [Lytechinus pictus]